MTLVARTPSAVEGSSDPWFRTPDPSDEKFNRRPVFSALELTESDRPVKPRPSYDFRPIDIKSFKLVITPGTGSIWINPSLARYRER